MNNLKLSIINDEISQDLDVCISYLNENSIGFVELRFANGKNILEHSLDEVNLIKRKLQNANIEVSCLGSPLFKWFDNNTIKNGENKTSQGPLFGFHDYLDLDKKIAYIKKAFEIANILQTKYIRVFSLLRNENAIACDQFWTLEPETFNFAFELASKCNITLLVENGMYTNLYSKKQILDIQNIFADIPLKLLLDLGTAYSIGEMIQINEIERIYNEIYYIHLKNYNAQSRVACELGKGVIKYDELLKLLLEKNYQGFLSLELEGKGEGISSVTNSLKQLDKYLN